MILCLLSERIGALVSKEMKWWKLDSASINSCVNCKRLAQVFLTYIHSFTNSVAHLPQARDSPRDRMLDEAPVLTRTCTGRWAISMEVRGATTSTSDGSAFNLFE